MKTLDEFRKMLPDAINDWLALADWLDEHNDERGKWMRIIVSKRVQVVRDGGKVYLKSHRGKIEERVAALTRDFRKFLPEPRGNPIPIRPTAPGRKRASPLMFVRSHPTVFDAVMAIADYLKAANESE